uniref:Uncharacterized protein n=1 Tax=Manihot esculenta TaxID=3983 RepID=A0A199UBW9_MANES
MELGRRIGSDKGNCGSGVEVGEFWPYVIAESPIFQLHVLALIDTSHLLISFILSSQFNIIINSKKILTTCFLSYFVWSASIMGCAAFVGNPSHAFCVEHLTDLYVFLRSTCSAPSSTTYHQFLTHFHSSLG